MSPLILKFVWKSKETRMAKPIVKKETVGRSKFHPYQRQCDINEGITHKGKRESSEIFPHKGGNFIFDKSIFKI